MSKGILHQTKADDRKTTGVPRISEVTSGVLLWANRQCTEMSLVLVLLFYMRTSFATLGFSLLAKVLYLLIFQGFVGSCVKATGEQLIPLRVTQGWFVNQKTKVLICSDSDSATICFEHAIGQTLNWRPSYPWSHLILLSMVRGCSQREANLEKWKKFKEYLGNMVSREKELDDLWNESCNRRVLLNPFSYIHLLMEPVSVRKLKLCPIGGAGCPLNNVFSISVQHFMLILFVSLQHLIP